MRGVLAAEQRRLPPTPRDRVGEKRLRARDAWNLRELSLEELYEKHDLDGSRGLDEWEFRHFFEEFLGDWNPTANADAKWLMCLADRDKDGTVDLEELYFGLRAWHGYRSLQRDALRMFAECDLECTPSVDRERLLELLTELNGQLPVPDVEADMILDNARFLGNGKAGRVDVLRSIGIWYTYVARRNTHWKALVRHSIQSWLPEREHHAEVLTHMSKSGPALSRGLIVFRRRGSTGGLLALGEEGGDEDERNRTLPATRGFARLLEVLTAITVHLAFLVALMFPSTFLLSLIIIGSLHGTDACPKDIDGLMVWYGALGLAAMVLNCSGTDTSGKYFLASCLRILMLFLPWLGAWWSLHLSRSDRHDCGAVLSRISIWLWVLLVSVELYFFAVGIYSIFRNFQREKSMRARPNV